MYESIHSDDLYDNYGDGAPLNLVGDFHGTPIIGWDPQATEVREATDAVLRMRNAKAYQETHSDLLDVLEVINQ